MTLKMQSKKQFIKNIENNIKNTIKKYKLINKKEKVIAAVSGGKDSTTLLYNLKKFGYNVEAITVDLVIGNYSKQNLKNITGFCKDNNIKLHTISLRKELGFSLCYARSLLKTKGFKINSCSLCGVIRRYLLNKKARQLKAKKIATGHNLDDEAQVILMNFLRATPHLSARLGLITGIIKDKKFVPRIKPLYFLSEKDIEQYSKLMNFPVIYGRCPCSVTAYRNTIRNLLNEYEKKFPDIKKNIINYFLKIQNKLKKYYITSEKPNYCKKCGEISVGKLCNVCNIIQKLVN